MIDRSLFSDNRSLLFSKRRLLLAVPSLGILGVRGVRGARIFSKLYTRVREDSFAADYTD